MLERYFTGASRASASSPSASSAESDGGRGSTYLRRAEMTLHDVQVLSA
jgi:hypothetical protein